MPDRVKGPLRHLGCVAAVLAGKPAGVNGSTCLHPMGTAPRRAAGGCAGEGGPEAQRIAEHAASARPAVQGTNSTTKA